MNVIIKEGLIAILRGVPEEKLLPVVKAMWEGGIRIVEVAFDPGDRDTVAKTVRAISGIREVLGERMVIGAGTVLRACHVTEARRAGAQFIFSPNTSFAVIEKTKEEGLISIPGAFTPTEMMAAYEHGADIIKLFPITKEDVAYVKNITRPLSHIPFICVGGTTPDTIADFFEAGAVGVGTGVSILKPEYLRNSDFEGIKRLAALHVQKVREWRERKKER